MMDTTTIKTTRRAISALTDDGWAWPHGAAISSWRALARRGHATETTGTCDGCNTHVAGTSVPVFRLAEGVRLVAAAGAPGGVPGRESK